MKLSRMKRAHAGVVRSRFDFRLPGFRLCHDPSVSSRVKGGEGERGTHTKLTTPLPAHLLAASAARMMFAALLCPYFRAPPLTVRSAVMVECVVVSQLMSSQWIPPFGATVDAIDATYFFSVRVSI